jgi:hypothetical protein
MTSPAKRALIEQKRKAIEFLRREADELREKGWHDLAAISDKRRKRTEKRLADLENGK